MYYINQFIDVNDIKQKGARGKTNLTAIIVEHVCFITQYFVISFIVIKIYIKERI